MFTSNHRCWYSRLAAAALVVGSAIGALPSSQASAGEKVKFTSVNDFTKCADGELAAPETCVELLHVFVKGRPAEAFAAGKAVRAKMNHAAAVPFFAKAFAAKSSPKKDRCADPDVAMAVAAGLDMSSSTIVTEALDIFFEKCWTELQKPVLKALTESGPSGPLAKNVCSKLAERKVANPSCEKQPVAAAPDAEPKWKDPDPKTMVPEGPAKVFKGDQGRTLTMVQLKAPGEYLIRFDGFRGEWNGRVVFHRETPAGSGLDYSTQVKGTRWVGVVVRDGATEAYPVGDKGPFHVGYDEAASKAASPQAVIDQFRKQKM